MKTFIIALLLAAGCRKTSEPPPPPPENPGIPVVNIQRAEEACSSYVKQVCACAETVPGAVQACAEAKMLPATIETATRVGQNETASRQDSALMADTLAKTTSTCLSKLSQLPTLGCAEPH